MIYISGFANVKPCLGQPTDEHNSDRETGKNEKARQDRGDRHRQYAVLQLHGLREPARPQLSQGCRRRHESRDHRRLHHKRPQGLRFPVVRNRTTAPRGNDRDARLGD